MGVPDDFYCGVVQAFLLLNGGVVPLIGLVLVVAVVVGVICALVVSCVVPPHGRPI